MISSKRLTWVLAAAAGLTVAGAVQGQYLTGTDGRMREQNNRIGSGGLNDGPQRMPNMTTGNFNNALITGDLTGGRNFRGDVNYTSPRAFRGPVSGIRTDSFIKESSGAPFGGSLQNNAQAVQPYFGASKGVAPPSNFVQSAPGTGGFVQGQRATREAGDMRIGETNNSTTTLLPRPGQLVMPGPVDPNTQTSTVITASPLYGVRTLNPNVNLADSAYLQHSLGGGLGNVRMDPALTQKMRQELIQSNNAPIDQGPLDQQGTDPTGRPTGTDLNNPLRGGFDAPVNTPLGESSMLQSNDGRMNSALDGGVATGAGTRQRLVTAPKIKSTQYTELEKRLSQYKTVQEMNELANAREFNQQQRAAQQQAEQRAAGGDPTTGAPRPGQPGGPPARDLPMGGRVGTGTTGGGLSSIPPAGPIGTTPAAPNDQIAIAVPTVPNPGTLPPSGAAPSGAAPAANSRPAPLKITSLADGVQGQALADLLKEAEELMRKESYNAAMEKYDVADLVAPNSPLVLLGKANVELGRTYYARAEASLRQAFMQDQALLMGQYNLQNLLGRDRLEIIVRDLRTIAEREATEARPVFLLAYIDYNTGNERRAAAYLDLAEKRAGANDALYPLIRKYWALPRDAAPADLNK